MNGTHSLLFCAHNVIPLMKTLKKVIIRRNAKVLFDCTKEVHVEDNTEKTNLYIYVCSLECRTVITTTN